ncbi:biogenesis of lysosome-related organelles complex 1 subunit 5-like [Xyrauchen texanus]|uniref:biogenesis of lysosome-related organelles complex 1 subunit 5-like n=1 Tax=Xyrauchen texanus TaxID=154827 RepID=UPI002242B505|nr:biogenesis of lysosome-related organelles complex 1 subunit 5-like [Xyrauchen texanus]
MMEKIIKNVSDIKSRLTDHRPVLQGEIRYFLKEFEVDLILFLKHFIFTLTVIEAVKHVAQRIQQRELESEQILVWCVCVCVCEREREREERRRQDWEDFQKEQCALKEEVVEEHAKAVSMLRRTK